MGSQNLTAEHIFNVLEINKERLKQFGVKRLGLFGSFLQNEQDEDSDIDFLVEFENPNFDNFMEMVEFLEDLFNREVELITIDSLSPYIKPYIEQEIKWYETQLAVS